MPLDPVVDLLLALLLGWVMAEAGVAKLRGERHFAALIDDYRLLKAGFGNRIVRPLGGVELALAAALLVPAGRAPAAGAVALLLALYAGAIAVNLWRGRRHIDCGCGGVRAQPISAALVARNLVLITMALALALATPSARAFGWLDGIVALGGAAVAILAYASANLLIANTRLLEQGR